MTSRLTGLWRRHPVSLVAAAPIVVGGQATAIVWQVELAVRQPRDLLIEWAAVVGNRDDRIRTVVESGLSKGEVHRLTGVARTTADRLSPGTSRRRPSR